MLQIRPLGTRIIIKNAEPENKTASGIVLTGEAQRKPIYAEVIAAGPGTEDEPMLIKAGDKVVFPETGGRTIVVDDVEYTIFKQEDILGVVEEVE